MPTSPEMRAARGAKTAKATVLIDRSMKILGKRDFPRTLTPAVLMDCPSIGAIPVRSGSGGFVEVEGQQVGNIGVAGALRQFGEDVAQPR